MATTLFPQPSTASDNGWFASATAVMRQENTRTVIALRGEWDFSTTRVLAGVLSRAIASDNGEVVVDLSEAAFIDTATARALAVGREWLDRQGRTLVFRSPSSLAIRVLSLFSLTDLIETREIDQP